jgi:hypothetical protein
VGEFVDDLFAEFAGCGEGVVGEQDMLGPVAGGC